ncbi:MAG: DUF2256 domain-containing protein [Gammaproteobacteria bacterium]|nr:DUF2256 domain-containing protein [Gammaproteobacteria bacterium]MBT5156382.1 DUF2256 domain-containing protein [Gammaproteobacteria bacterium]MBT5683486.1 DUF2256 domain-containing protein [Gammaproteobacteria bacterium]MBT5725207.1 DUF2256 domain-containing protein [Gammaproteobacteria bacterium]MBT6584768.1 DUF2256 domain-containing protein [Gammaproteobacteria bacterium]
MTHHKQQLPEKVCKVCERAFSWRKKWARDWPKVKYCSQRCKRQAKSSVGCR